MSTIDVDELLPQEYLFEKSGGQLFNAYLTPKRFISDEMIQKETKSHRRMRYFVMFTHVVFIIRSITIFTAMNQDLDSESLAILIGDFAYWIP